MALRESVGVPGKNAVGLPRFDAIEHLVEDRTTGQLRALLFDQNLDDANLLSICQ